MKVILKRTIFKDVSLTKLQDNLVDMVSSLNENQLLQGQLVGPFTLTTTPTLYEHKLARKLIGYIPTKQSDHHSIAYTASTTASPYDETKYFKLHSAATITEVEFWVF